MKFKIAGLSFAFVIVFGTMFIASSTEQPIEEDSVTSDMVNVVSETENNEVNSEYIWPSASTQVSCNYECYEDHNGIDIAGGLGTEIYAVADGTVVDAGFDNMGNGYYVLIDHGNNVQTLYGHLEEELQVKVGDVVTQGQVIGFEGDTGNVTAPNMHFEIIVDGISQDPNQYLA